MKTFGLQSCLRLRLSMRTQASSTLIARFMTKESADISASAGMAQRYYDLLGEKLAQKGEFTALSFFKFAQRQRQRPVTDATALGVLKEKLASLKIKGTLLVAANEGYNGAFCVPSEALGKFYRALVSADEVLFDSVDLNIGQSFSCADDSKLPFKKLVVRQKAAVLTDGLPDKVQLELDFTDAGCELEPGEWHKELASSKPPLVIDCRNMYESEMGTFQNSVPLNTTTFAESWDKLDSLLSNVDKDQRVLTFCTGGIRCIKVNSYLKQKLGMTNIARLQKGIIHYEKWLEEEELDGQSFFKGKNFLFDRRRLAAGSLENEEFGEDEGVNQQPVPVTISQS